MSLLSDTAAHTVHPGVVALFCAAFAQICLENVRGSFLELGSATLFADRFAVNMYVALRNCRL